MSAVYGNRVYQPASSHADTPHSRASYTPGHYASELERRGRVTNPRYNVASKSSGGEASQIPLHDQRPSYTPAAFEHVLQRRTLGGDLSHADAREHRMESIMHPSAANAPDERDIWLGERAPTACTESRYYKTLQDRNAEPRFRSIDPSTWRVANPSVNPPVIRVGAPRVRASDRPDRVRLPQQLPGQASPLNALIAARLVDNLLGHATRPGRSRLPPQRESCDEGASPAVVRLG